MLPAILLTLVMLALVAYAAHARLAAERPSPQRLTAFYLVVATGGAVGGLLNGVLAPQVFDRVLEYPLTLVAVPLLLLGAAAAPDSWLVRQLRANRVRAALVLALVAAAPMAMRLLVWSGADSLAALGVLLAAARAVGW